MEKQSPIRPTDEEARKLARRLIDKARFGALAVIDPDTGAPMVSRVAAVTDFAGTPLTLVSDLSQHTKALRADPRCSLLVGEPGSKGDPLTHPRLTIQARASFVEREGKDYADLRERYLELVPKAGLYIDFLDFSLVHLLPTGAYLNGGFGKAFVLTPDDLAPAQDAGA